MRRLLVLLTILVGFSFPALADFQEGIAAFKRGAYAAALHEFRPLAEAGHPPSQTNLGLMYSKGYGVPADDAEAVKWYRLAAEKGQPVAQNNLGFMYIEGEGGPKDYVLGLMWLILASEKGYAPAAAAVTAQEQEMTPKEINLAKRFVELWKEKLALSR